MDDRKFIEKFLVKNYVLKTNENGVIAIDNFTGRETYLREFEALIIKQLGNYITDEGIPSILIIESWIKRTIKILIGEFEDFLRGCKVRLGEYKSSNPWKAYNKDGDVSLTLLLNLFCLDFSNEFITQYFGEWFSDRVAEETERIMGIY